jgi:hypothetical protein
MNGDSVEQAAAWLIEESNQECKNTLISQRKVLLAQSEVINDKINTRNEHDIQVKDDSLLFPYDITDMYWTMNNGQLTLNKYFRNEINTKVFSIYEKDEAPILSEEKHVEEKKKSKNWDTPQEEPGNLFDSDESDEEAIKSPSLKRSDPSNANAAVDANGMPIVQSSNYEKALKMYHKIPLKGSYIKSIKDVKVLDYDMTMTYDHAYNKFYGLVSSQNNKVVLVGQDMSEMSKTTFSTEEEAINAEIPEFDENEKPTLSGLVNKALEFFLHFERIRYDLPWRWRRWSTVFSNANDVLGIKDPKITKRYEKIRDYELNQWRMKFGLEQQILKSKQSKSKKPAMPVSTPASYYTQLATSTLTGASTSN